MAWTLGLSQRSHIAAVPGSRVVETTSTSDLRQGQIGSNVTLFTPARMAPSINVRHVARDTGANRVLISNDFVYFGGEGPRFPEALKDWQGRHLCKAGIGLTIFDDPQLIVDFQQWVRSLGMNGYQGAPFEWLTLRK